MDKEKLSFVFSILIASFILNALMVKKNFEQKKYNFMLNHIIISLVVLLLFLGCLIWFW
jgi:hypothetical protein